MFPSPLLAPVLQAAVAAVVRALYLCTVVRGGGKLLPPHAAAPRPHFLNLIPETRWRRGGRGGGGAHRSLLPHRLPEFVEV